MSNVHLFAKNQDPEIEAASLRQEAVDAAHRALTQGTDGVRNFPIFLRECFERRAWENVRVFSGGTRQEPIPFRDFVHQPYPVGLGTSFDAIEKLIRGDVQLVALWTEVTRRPQGERTDLLDNVQDVAQAPTGNSAAAGLRKLQKAAGEGNQEAGAQLAEAVEGRKSVHRACVDAGLRKSTKIDRDVKQRCERSVAEWIVSHAGQDDLSPVVADLFAAVGKGIAVEIKNLIRDGHIGMPTRNGEQA